MSEARITNGSPLKPPFENWRFWTVQALVALTVGIFGAVSVHCGNSGGSHSLCLLSISLYFVPLTYAALTFGFIGSLATALWCMTLSFLIIALEDRGEQGLIAAFQVTVVTAVALFVGKRVDREIRMRWQAESAEMRLQLSEGKYRSLFETSPIPLLLVSPDGIVREANPAAGILFGRPMSALQNISLVDILNSPGQMLLEWLAKTTSRAPVIAVTHGQDVSAINWIEPSVTKITDSGDGTLFQVMLKDVTEERRRHEHLHAYASSVLQAQEAERRRIAQELHDETIQSLIILCRQVDAIRDQVSPLQPAVITGLETVRLSAEQIVQSLREFSSSLRPSVLEDLGLAASLRRLVEDLKQRTGIASRLEVRGPVRRLAADAELGLFRIGQEALHNVERHAQATSVTVRLTFVRNQVSLTVQDNGVGFTPGPQDDPKAALGILGMQERAQLLDGKLEIQSSPGRGTKVTIHAPAAEVEH